MRGTLIIYIYAKFGSHNTAFFVTLCSKFYQNAFFSGVEGRTNFQEGETTEL